jgi:peroxiredoxin Q/BCP
MAQLRQDYDKFVERDAVILVIGPNNQSDFQDFWQKNELPFSGLPDPEHRVADIYGQQVKILRMGRMPAMVVVDKNGNIRYRHLGDSMRDIVSNENVLVLLDKINREYELELSLDHNLA